MSDEQEQNPQEPEPKPEEPEEPAQEEPEQPVQEEPVQEPVEEAPETKPEKPDQEDQSVDEKRDEPPKETQDEPPQEKQDDEPPKEQQARDEETEQDGDEDVRDEPAHAEEKPSETGFEATEEPPKEEKMQQHEAMAFSSEGLETLLADIAPQASDTQDFVLPTEFLKTSKPKAKTALGSAIDIRRSVGMEGFDKRMARYANTYRLEPNNPFNVEVVDKILKATMDEAIANMSYEPEKCLRIAKWVSGVIRGKVKELDFDRYKIIAIATIGEKHLQDMMVTCRSLWDGEKDRYSFYATENDKVYAIAMCFGIYYE